MRRFNWRKFRNEVTPELYCYLRENYWREISMARFYFDINKVLEIPDCIPMALRRYGETIPEVYDWLRREYGWFDGRTPRQRYNSKDT